MRFHETFTRNKGGSGTALGSDAAPSISPKESQDNVYSGKLYSATGPSYRLVIGYVAPSGALALDCDVHVWDDFSGKWWLLPGSGAGTLTPGKLASFDLPVPAERVIKPSDEDKNQRSTGFSAYVRVTDPGAAPNGDHKFYVYAAANQKGT